MKGLLAKDFALLMQRKRIFLLVLVFVAFMIFKSSDTIFAISWLVMIFSIFSLGTIAYDEYDNSMPFLMTMPITGKIYAVEKYVFGLLCGLGALMFSIIMLFIKSAVTQNFENITFDIMTASAFVPVVLIILSASLPVNLKWGSEKGRIALIIIFGVFFLAISLLKKFFDDAYFTALLSKLSSLGVSKLLAIVTAFSLAMLGASVLISINVMKAKEY